jgi:alpha-amylase
VRRPGDAGLPDLLGSSYVVGQQRQLPDGAQGPRRHRLPHRRRQAHAELSHINAVLTPEIKSGVHVFGEIITGGGAGDGEYNRFLRPTSTAPTTPPTTSRCSAASARRSASAAA